MDLEKLNSILKDEPAYRARQAYRALFVNLIEDWAEASDLPGELRKRLSAHCPLTIKAVTVPAPDKNALKAAFYFDDTPVEAVLLRHADGRNTVCVSSQVGCALGCVFCATGKMGLRRNLRYGEIVAQALFFARYLKKSAQTLTNVVFMGMGEPLLNYQPVMRAVKTLNDHELFNIGARKISISTVGITAGINKLASEPLQVNLAVSLHAPDDDLRSRLMPINNKEPLKKVLSAVNYYTRKTSRRVMVEYVLIKGVNDSPAAAGALAALLKTELAKPYFVNLIAYNDTGEFFPSLPRDRERFRRILEHERITVVERYRFGRDIAGACGQLAGGKNTQID